jgi:hypothetical protein
MSNARFQNLILNSRDNLNAYTHIWQWFLRFVASQLLYEGSLQRESKCIRKVIRKARSFQQVTSHLLCQPEDSWQVHGFNVYSGRLRISNINKYNARTACILSRCMSLRRASQLAGDKAVTRKPSVWWPRWMIINLLAIMCYAKVLKLNYPMWIWQD